MSGDAIFIHLDDQMDAKSLLGAYTCTAVPGEFAWQPGPLTQVWACRWIICCSGGLLACCLLAGRMRCWGCVPLGASHCAAAALSRPPPAARRR
jgi:hypothetical protein